MNSFIFAVVAFAVAASAAFPGGFPKLTREEYEGNTWVLMAAGAIGWENYRMQADICHAYHVFRNLGIPDERIIVMMYDDIANDPQNPYPGQVINDIGGSDVYAGVPHDYTGKDCSGPNFLSLMAGESVIPGRKTLNSTYKDNVLVYYCDHGGNGIIAFPYSIVTRGQLLNNVVTMYKKRMFKNLYLNIDACYSGSMIFNASFPQSFYVTTAAPVGEYAYSCDYDSNLRNFPCDRFSHYWLTDLEQNLKSGWSFDNEFEYIQQNSDYSQACRYGHLDYFGRFSIDDFLGIDRSKDKKRIFGPTVSNMAAQSKRSNAGVAQIDVPLALAQHWYEENPTKENQRKLQRELNIRKSIDAVTERIIKAAKPGLEPITLPACPNCDESCPCYQYCLNEKTPDYCRAECCDEDAACNQAPPSGVQECLDTLSTEFLNECGYEHAYLRKADVLFYRLCKRDSVNVAAAVSEIRKQCKSFRATSF